MFRILIFVGACVLVAYGTWLLASESARPRLETFAEVMATPSSEQVRQKAATAAQFGIIRGDLWADDALALAAGLEGSFANGGLRPAPAALASARAAAERSARLAPHDGRLWLLIATIDARAGPRNRQANSTLKMSYYTAPNDPALMPIRSAVATRTETIEDPDLQLLVASEIRTILGGRPDLKPAILAAYRDAPAAGRNFIESVLREAGSELLARIRANPSP